MYQNVSEIPSQVTASLNSDDARAWMNKYNESLGGLDDPSEQDVLAARRNAWYSVKDSPSSYSFCAKATVEAMDNQREIVDLQSVKSLMDDYIAHAGPMSFDHSNYIVGTVWGWEPIDTEEGPGIAVWGNLFRGDGPVYDGVRKAFARGANKLSIAGDAPRDRTCDSEHGCYIRRKMRQLMEIAITPHPVNKYATLIWKNESALSKSDSDEAGPVLALDLGDVMIHRSEDDCPIMRMRNALRKSGVDAHARMNGVFIPGVSASECDALAKAAGMRMEPVDGGILVPSFDRVLEDEFKKSFSRGEIFADGHLTPAVTRERFDDLWNLGLLTKDGNGFRFANTI